MCAETLLAVLNTEDSEEALLYCVGALKFLSGNDAILRLLLDNHCMSAVQKLIRTLCGAEVARSAMAGHILVQVQPWGGAWIKFEHAANSLNLTFEATENIRRSFLVSRFIRSPLVHLAHWNTQLPVNAATLQHRRCFVALYLFDPACR